ncbi:hypothetical protein [Mycobacterium tilburgii]|uniref:hypothetical protein n=1 Tax=Mycobacterium tilburgii TaxID=44467 RepID=UPI0021B310DA|nr:hypothetical protein [Mycobacterium tilburgii]
MTGFALATTAGVVVGLTIGAAASIGVTLAVKNQGDGDGRGDHGGDARTSRARGTEPDRAVSGELRRAMLARALHPLVMTLRDARPERRRLFC